jgi:cytochrome c553
MVRIALLFVAALPFVASVAPARADDPPKGAPPPARAIPGVNAPDAFPNACVDCHLEYKERNMDVRLSTLMNGWREKVSPALLEKTRAAAPTGVRLEGRHPDATAALKSIPAGCVTCHGKDSKRAPQFAALIHAVHLTGGAENVFITAFQGECTHCHKLDASTGRTRVPSAAEK